MAKVIPMDLIKSLSGKACSHSDVYFARRGDKIYTGKLCNKRSTEFSTAELERQEKFKKATQAAKAALADGTQRTALEAEFQNQSRYTTLRGYVIAKEYAKA